MAATFDLVNNFTRNLYVLGGINTIMKKLFLVSIITTILLLVTGCGTDSSQNRDEQDMTSDTEQNEKDLSSNLLHDVPFDELINRIIKDGHEIAIVGESDKYSPPSRFENSVKNIDIENIASRDYLAVILMSDQLKHLDNTDVLDLIENGTTVFIEREALSIEELIKWVEDKEIPAEMGESRKDEELIFVHKDREEGIIAYGAILSSEDGAERLNDLYEQVLYVSYMY